MDSQYLPGSSPENATRRQGEHSEDLATSMKRDEMPSANAEQFEHHDALPAFQNDAIQQSDDRITKPQSGEEYKLKRAKAGYAKGTWSSAQSIGVDPESPPDGKQGIDAAKVAGKEKYYRYPHPGAPGQGRVHYQTSSRPVHRANMSEDQSSEPPNPHSSNFQPEDGLS